MSRYIDADELLKAINSWQKFGVDERCRIVPWNEDLEPYIHLRDAIMAISGMPTADVVEIVRCKDCVHCADDWNGNQPMFTCEIGMCHESVEPNGYCFCGERREDDKG